MQTKRSDIQLGLGNSEARSLGEEVYISSSRCWKDPQISGVSRVRRLFYLDLGKHRCKIKTLGDP